MFKYKNNRSIEQDIGSYPFGTFTRTRNPSFNLGALLFHYFQLRKKRTPLQGIYMCNNYEVRVLAHLVDFVK